MTDSRFNTLVIAIPTFILGLINSLIVWKGKRSIEKVEAQTNHMHETIVQLTHNDAFQLGRAAERENPTLPQRSIEK